MTSSISYNNKKKQCTKVLFSVKFFVQQEYQQINIYLRSVEHFHDRGAFVLHLQEILKDELDFVHRDAHEFGRHLERAWLVGCAYFEQHVLEPFSEIYR